MKPSWDGNGWDYKGYYLYKHISGTVGERIHRYKWQVYKPLPDPKYSKVCDATSVSMRLPTRKACMDWVDAKGE